MPLIYQPDHVNLERVLLWTMFSYWSCFLLLSGECNSNLLLKSHVGMNSDKIIYLTNPIVTSKLHARAMMSRFLNLSTILPSDIRNAIFMITMDVNALNTNYFYVWYLIWYSINLGKTSSPPTQNTQRACPRLVIYYMVISWNPVSRIFQV